MKCAGIATNGRPCRLEALEGVPFCAKHVVSMTTSEDPADILRALMKESDKRVRLRASIAYINYLARQKNSACKRCADLAVKDEIIEDAVRRITPEQRARLATLVAEVRAIKEAALLQPVYQEPA